MTFNVTQLSGSFPRQPDPLLSPFCHCSPNRLNCQRTPCFASAGFRNCNIHLTVCQERLQKLKVIDVEGAAIGIGAMYQALTKKMHNSRRPFSSRIVRENCDDDSNRNIQILNVYCDDSTSAYMVICFNYITK